MKTIHKKISAYNNSSRSGEKIKYIVIHWVGAVSTAKNNADYFAGGNRNASAHYFVDDTSIYQSVETSRSAWHCGGGLQGKEGHTLHGKCKNSNSIGIEMCCKKVDGRLVVTEQTQKNTAELVQYLMKKFNITAKNVIRHFDVTGKSCLPLDVTELLTPNGWVYLKDIGVGDIVTQADENGNLSFTKVEEIVTPYMSKVISSGKIEATANHRMWCKPNCINGTWKFREWGSLLEGKKMTQIPCVGTLPATGLELSDDEIRLLVAIQADGHYMQNKSKDKCQGIEFHFAKKRKIERIQMLLECLNIDYTICVQSNKTVKIRIYGQEIYEFAEQYLDNKNFTFDWIDMDYPQSVVFFDEIIKWDGSVENNSYFSSIEENINVIQAIAVTHGVRSLVYHQKNGGKVVSFHSLPYKVISAARTKQNSRVASVGCVTVEEGRIVVRQNGRVHIVGNCPTPYTSYARNGSSKWITLHKLLTNVKIPIPKPKKLKVPTKTLIKGNSGEQVKDLQRCLNKILKLNLVVDGYFGSDTEKAVKAFQKKYKLKVDGYCGKQTRAKMKQFI